jgi:hypothetical protein
VALMGKRFVRLFNEAQMVLFSHPLTEARDGATDRQ